MTLLLTSFTTWKSTQLTNAADDLVALAAQHDRLPDNTTLLRHLPVDFDLAPQQVIQAIADLRPRAVICCGMAEKRDRLTLESGATLGDYRLTTTVDLATMLAPLGFTELSHDAGNFVCNTLYFSVLAYLSRDRTPIPALFVHVPVLTDDNRAAILDDFSQILQFFQ